MSDTGDDVYDPGGGGANRRVSTPSSPAFSDGSTGRDGASPQCGGGGDTANEHPLFATVAQFCKLGVVEECALPAAPAAAAAAAVLPATTAGGEGGAAGADGDCGQVGTSPTMGGGGAVTPALLPSLFPEGDAAGCAVSEGVRMVLSSVEQEGGATAAGSASPGMFSLHSVASRDAIVKASLFVFFFSFLFLFLG